MGPTQHNWLAYIPADAEKTLAVLADHLIGGEQTRVYNGKDANYALANLGTDLYQIGERLDHPDIAEEQASLIIRDNELHLRVLDLTQNRGALWALDNSVDTGLRWAAEGQSTPEGFENYIEVVPGDYRPLPGVAELV